MLYEGETVERWDPETGEDYKEYADTKEKAEIAAFRRKAEDLKSLKQTPGWSLLTEFLNESVDAYKEAIASEDNFEKIVRLQEAIKAYRNVEAYVDWTINEAKKFDNNQAPSED